MRVPKRKILYKGKPIRRPTKRLVKGKTALEKHREATVRFLYNRSATAIELSACLGLRNPHLVLENLVAEGTLIYNAPSHLYRLKELREKEEREKEMARAREALKGKLTAGMLGAQITVNPIGGSPYPGWGGLVNGPPAGSHLYRDNVGNTYATSPLGEKFVLDTRSGEWRPR